MLPFAPDGGRVGVSATLALGVVGALLEHDPGADTERWL